MCSRLQTPKAVVKGGMGLFCVALKSLVILILARGFRKDIGVESSSAICLRAWAEFVMEIPFKPTGYSFPI